MNDFWFVFFLHRRNRILFQIKINIIDFVIRIEYVLSCRIRNLNSKTGFKINWIFHVLKQKTQTVIQTNFN